MKPSLNAQQHQAITTISRPCLVLAGAGSGKTSVITHKIAYLINECGIPAKHIAAVTFTNKAAKEMKDRIQELILKPKGRGLWISTFHTLGLRMIQTHQSVLGLRPGFSIYDNEDSKQLLKALRNSKNLPLDDDALQLVQRYISSCKQEVITPAQAANLTATEKQEANAHFAALFDAYQQALKAYNAVDFDDLISLPVMLLDTHDAIAEQWQTRIRYLLIDEYQDTNTAQYRLVQALMGENTGLTAVGDDDQSIYAWRGSKPENLAQLEHDFRPLSVIKLEQNYRSTLSILNSANHLIKNNPHVFEKKLWSQMGFGEPIRIIATANETHEIERIVNDIVAHRLSHQSQYSDYAILYRSNHQARALEMRLQQENLPYYLSGGTSFFARSEIKDIMAYLRLLVNPADDNALLRIINTPKRKIGTQTLQALAQCAAEHDTSLFDTIALPSLADKVPNAQRLQHFYEWVQTSLQDLAHTETPYTSLQRLLEAIDYEAWLIRNSSNEKAAQKRWKNVQYLLTNLRQVHEKLQEDDNDAGLKDAIHRLMLFDLLEQQNKEDEQGQAIQLSTLHAAKGLEWPHVYIMGLEEGMLPHHNSIADDQIEEERRLMYVGITRAKHNLTLTYANKRKQQGEFQETTHSRFLDELPNEHIQWQGHRQHSSADDQLHKNQQAIDSLKALFD